VKLLQQIEEKPRSCVFQKAARCSLAVMLDVMLGGFGGVMAGMGAMAAGGVGMMRRDLVIVLLIMLGGFAVMARGLFMMLGGAVVMVAGGMFVRHVFRPFGSYRAGMAAAAPLDGPFKKQTCQACFPDETFLFPDGHNNPPFHPVPFRGRNGPAGWRRNRHRAGNRPWICYLPTRMPSSTFSRPKTCSSHSTTAITTTALRMDLIFPSIGI